MRSFLILLALLLIAPATLSAADRPNILFIITDDMYPRQMNFMPEGAGRNHTPNLDRLAEEGIVMRNQYVSSTVCTPSRYTVMTGRYASRSQDPKFVAERDRLGQTHVQWNTFVNTAKEKTVANRLQEAGYRTGFVGKDHAVLTPGHKPLGLSADIDDPAVQKTMRENAQASREALQAAGFEYVSRVYHNNPDFNGSRTLAVHNQDWITEGALEFLGQGDGRPFFLYFATTIPHGPNSPERSWKADRRATPEGLLDYTPEVQPDADSIARRAQRHGVEGRETIIWFDDALGALLNRLDALGELDDTVIIFFNDHGQDAKGSVYQGGAWNPSVVWRHGGWPAGSESAALVSNIDFAPTMLDLAGAPRPDDVDGASFLPILQGRAAQIRDSLFFEMGYTRGVLKDDFKYIALRYPPVIANLTRAERQANLDHMNDNLRERGRPVHNEDPMAPFGHLMPVPGGHDAEQGAVRAYPHYYDADQLYYLVEDPDERDNLWGRPGYEARQEALQDLLQAYLVTLPGGFPLIPAE
jgi:arylsulfatase A-like enzyme